MAAEPIAIGIVHARGGSKRIPLKNLKLLGGKPLIAWIIEAAKASSTLRRVIVSTDHDGIMEAARACGAEVPFRRPPELAEDVPSELVTQHAVRFLEETEGLKPDVIVTLQPTTPFCRPGDIDACVRKVRETDADSAITVGPIRERPEWMYSVDGDRATSFLNTMIQGESGVSQSLPRLYIPNGAAYATRYDVLMRQNLIVGKNLRVQIMPDRLSVDIDEPVDFLVAEQIARTLFSE